MIGIYDKWHPENGNWMPGDDDVDPRPFNPIPNPGDRERTGGASPFWIMFSILIFLAIIAILIKFYGNECLARLRGENTVPLERREYIQKFGLMDNGPGIGADTGPAINSEGLGLQIKEEEETVGGDNQSFGDIKGGSRLKFDD